MFIQQMGFFCRRKTNLLHFYSFLIFFANHAPLTSDMSGFIINK